MNFRRNIPMLVRSRDAARQLRVLLLAVGIGIALVVLLGLIRVVPYWALSVGLIATIPVVILSYVFFRYEREWAQQHVAMVPDRRAAPPRATEFQDAERRYAELKRQFDAGTISIDDFNAKCERLMIQDDEGHWWAIDPTNDEWTYYDGSDWIPGAPPIAEPPPSDGSDWVPGAPPTTEPPPSESRPPFVFSIDPRWIFLGFLTLLLLFGSFYILLSHPDAPWIFKGAQYPESVSNVAAGAIGSILTFWFVPKA
jgi:hypothetical protein